MFVKLFNTDTNTFINLSETPETCVSGTLSLSSAFDKDDADDFSHEEADSYINFFKKIGVQLVKVA